MSISHSHNSIIMSRWGGDNNSNNPIDLPGPYHPADQDYDDFQPYQQFAPVHLQHGTSRTTRPIPLSPPPPPPPPPQLPSSSQSSSGDANNFLFVTDNSKEGRRNARSFVMQKARAKDPWSTSKKTKTPSPTIGSMSSPEVSPVTSAPRISKSRTPRSAQRPSSSGSSTMASPVGSQAPHLAASRTLPGPSHAAPFTYCPDCQAAHLQGWPECARCAHARAAQAGHHHMQSYHHQSFPGAGPFGPAGIVQPSRSAAPQYTPHGARWSQQAQQPTRMQGTDNLPWGQFPPGS